jgi:hypothetical protein
MVLVASLAADTAADALTSFGHGNNFCSCSPPSLIRGTIARCPEPGAYLRPGDFTGTVDQDFTTAAALDPNLEPKQEGSGGVNLKPTNTAWRVWWELPDTGFDLWSAATINSNAWAATGLTPITQGPRRTVFAANVTNNTGFFQLRKGGGGAISPPVPLESFESGAFTGAANPPYTNVARSTPPVTDGTPACR